MNWFSGFLKIWLLRQNESAAVASWREPDITHRAIPFNEVEGLLAPHADKRVHAMYEPSSCNVSPGVIY